MFKIEIDGKEHKLFTSATINLTYDTVASTFSIDSSLTDEAIRQKMLPPPLSYKTIKIYIEKPNNTTELLLTGVITKHEGNLQSAPSGVRISGYSKTGVIADCTIAKASYPLQDDNKTLKQITDKILKPFGLSLFVNDIVKKEANTPIQLASAEEGEIAASYIVKLASQLNIVTGHKSNGQLLFTKQRANEKASSNYEEGKGEVINISYQVDGRAVHSRYTVLRQPEVEDTQDANPEEAVTNNIVPAFRPLTKMQTSGGSSVTENAAIAARMAGLKNAVKYELTVSSLFYQNGQPIRPNRIITLKAPSAYLSQETRLFVVSTTLSVTANSSQAVITCVLAEA